MSGGRKRDGELAARASAAIFEHVTASQSGRAPHIPYDFSMELSGYDKLFCSKLIRLAFDLGSAGRTKLPAYPTSLSVSNRDFLERIGVTAITTFAPGDLELDPAFEVVAEWRDDRMTTRIRLYDAVMDKKFAWMDQYGYVYKESFATWLTGKLGRISAFLPQVLKNLLVSFGLPEVPRNMSRRTVSAIAMLTWTTDPIAQALERYDRKVRRATGRPIHLRDAYNWLENHRRRNGRRIGFLVRPARRRA